MLYFGLMMAALQPKHVCTLYDPMSFLIWDRIEYTHSVYLDYVVLWPDDGCVAAETCVYSVGSHIVSDMGSYRVHTFYVPRLCSTLA